jgi:pimeloyl-ACP methyl ester carboxylesterase
VRSVSTEILEIFYEDLGPLDGPTILLLHGWPDAPRGWNPVAEQLNSQGWRTIIPFLRGSLPTRFLDESTPRFAAGVALAQDAIDLADALGIKQFSVVGHDWGARAAYIMATLFPEKLKSIAALALGYQPRGVFKVPAFEQSKRFWYQWFQCTDGGADAVRHDPAGFARIQWDTWSPKGWFDDTEFTATAESFKSSDWSDITLNGYRRRWLPEEVTDSRYDSQQQYVSQTESVSVPTLMIQGASDFCDAPNESEGLDSYFTAEYRRIVLEGVGHFPHREAPSKVAETVNHFLREYVE